MKIRNCKECGKLFQYDGISKLCFSCRRKDDEDFKKVKEFLYENPKEVITTVAEETGVSEEKILRYLREGKLEIVGESPGILLDCESCGRAIRTGRFCEKCAQQIERGLKSGFVRRNQEKEDIRSARATKDRMYTSDLKRKRK